jgi:hypothetical protein
MFMGLDPQAVRSASKNVRAMAVVERLYRATDSMVAAHRPICRQRGDCCRFDEFGHMLFATTMEFAYFLKGHAPLVHPNQDSACPYMHQSLCMARLHRPIGCRVFFCQPGSAQWQSELTERLLGVLRRIHLRFGVPYFYCEWRRGLAELTDQGERGA